MNVSFIHRYRSRVIKCSYCSMAPTLARIAHVLNCVKQNSCDPMEVLYHFLVNLIPITCLLAWVSFYLVWNMRYRRKRPLPPKGSGRSYLMVNNCLRRYREKMRQRIFLCSCHGTQGQRGKRLHEKWTLHCCVVTCDQRSCVVCLQCHHHPPLGQLDLVTNTHREPWTDFSGSCHSV